MHASTHTFNLDPAATWRPLGTRKTVAPRSEAPAIVGSVDIDAAGEPAITVADAERDRRRSRIGDALELGCFVTTLTAIGLLQLGVFALLA